MSQSITISVIIPLYNAKPYVSKCIDSLLAQTLSTFELIVVNDGSTDGSEAVVSKYMQMDSRIQLLHQSNQGVSVARNLGIQYAKGEYMTFVDADDFLEIDYLEKLYRTVNQFKVSIVVANFKSEVDGNWIPQTSVYETNRLILKNEIQQNILPIFLKKDTLNSSCIKLFETQFILKHQINFPVGMTNGEDALFCLKAFVAADSVVFTDLCGYCYRSVSGSASRNILDKDYLGIALDNYEFDHQNYANLTLDAATIQQYKSQRLINNLYALIHIYLQPNKNISWLKRLQKVNSIINNTRVHEIFQKNGFLLENHAYGYRKMMLRSIRNRQLIMVLLLSIYSNFKNHYYLKNKN